MVEESPLAFLVNPQQRDTASLPVVKDPKSNDDPKDAPGIEGGILKKEVYVKVRIDTNEPGYTVTVNGRPTSVTDDVFDVLMGIDLKIEVSKPGFDPRFIETKLGTPEPRTLKVALNKIEKGYLTFFTNPGADVYGPKFNMPLAYNKDADERSWAEMQAFFNGLFRKK